MTERSLVCAECGAAFGFSAAEQEQFVSRGFAEPKRCRPCRAAKRRRQVGHGGGALAAGPSSRTEPVPRRQRSPAELHPAVCNTCGAATEVPFRPDGLRPIFCLPCLKQRTR